METMHFGDLIDHFSDHSASVDAVVETFGRYLEWLHGRFDDRDPTRTVLGG
jgi:hypothetical protein